MHQMQNQLFKHTHMHARTHMHANEITRRGLEINSAGHFKSNIPKFLF